MSDVSTHVTAERERVLAAIEEAIGGLRDALVSSSDDVGAYLVAAVLDRAIDIARIAAEPPT